MAKRVVIGASASSPLLISSSSSIDADAAPFDSLIFNGNCQALRVWQTGYVVANGNNTVGALPLPTITNGPGGFSTPAGTTPLFMIAGRNSDLIENGPFPDVRACSRTRQSGMGGTIANGQFFALNFADANVTGRAVSVAYVNYCIFRNYG
jgi:hypothetical protein